MRPAVPHISNHHLSREIVIAHLPSPRPLRRKSNSHFSGQSSFVSVAQTSFRLSSLNSFYPQFLVPFILRRSRPTRPGGSIKGWFYRVAVSSYSGDIVRPLAPEPSILGIGLRRALELVTRGTPCRTRGSFISAGSNFAGTVAPSARRNPYCQSRTLTSCDNGTVVIGYYLAVWGIRRCVPPQVVGSV